MTGAVAGFTTLGALAGLAATPAHATSAVTTTNLYGADRYQSAGISNAKAFPNGVNEVVLADGLPGHQGDALAASGYAGVNGYGVLLTDNTNSVPSNTLAALKSLNVKVIQPVGGTAAIPAAQLTELAQMGYTVKPSLAGPTSLDTMEAIDDTIPPSSVGTSGSGSSGTGTLKTAILASVDENHLIDALSAAGLSYANKFPLITTESSSSTLSPQAQQVITALGIQKLIVVGGTASIPASQYNPMPTGVTSIDQQGGVDRAATSYLLATDEVANYGMSKTAMDLATGATASATPNDGADALSSAPFAGSNKIPTLVTDGPTQLQNSQGPVTFATNEASTLTNINVMTGPANLPQSQVNQVVTAAGGTTTTPTTAYTVSGGSLALPASTGSAPTQGVETYTVTGLPTAAGTTVNIALFPLAGSTKCADGVGNTANGPTSSGTFTPPGCSGTTASAGTAQGEGMTTSGGSTTGCLSVTPSSGSATAYIASVNGVPSACANGNAATIVYGVSATNGTLSFVVNSFQLDAVTPVVYTAPSSAGATPALVVTATGTPQTGYAVGVGSPSAWSAPSAPATSGGYVVETVLTPPLSGTNTFDGMVIACISSTGSDGNSGDSGATTNCPTGVNTFAAGSPVTLGSVFSFNYGTTGSTYAYQDGTPLTMPTFASYLSALSKPYYPGSTSQQLNVNGDQVVVGGATGYANGAPSSFKYDTSYNSGALGFGFGDVPAAPGTPNASYNGCAYTSGTTCQPGVVVSWTPPVNPDVTSYQVWRSTITSGAQGTAQSIGYVNATTSSVTPGVSNGDLTGGNTPASSPEFIDTTITAGAQYIYYVVAYTAAGATGQNSPFSAGSSTVTAGAAAAAPTITSVAITPSNLTATGTTSASDITGTPGQATITYAAKVTCLSGAGPDFSYSNSGQPTVGSVKGTTSCTVLNPDANGFSTTLQVTFPMYFTSTVGSTTSYYPENVSAPANGDTFTYTAPSPSTTANAVYAGTTASPVYAATQTVTSQGPTASSTNPLAMSGAPSMVSAVVTTGANAGGTTPGSAGTILVTYNQAVTCPSTSTAYTYSNGGTPVSSTYCDAVSGNPDEIVVGGTGTLVAPTAGDTFKYTAPATNSITASTFSGSATTGGPTYAATQTLTKSSATANTLP